MSTRKKITKPQHDPHKIFSEALPPSLKKETEELSEQTNIPFHICSIFIMIWGQIDMMGKFTIEMSKGDSIPINHESVMEFMDFLLPPVCFWILEEDSAEEGKNRLLAIFELINIFCEKHQESPQTVEYLKKIKGKIAQLMGTLSPKLQKKFADICFYLVKSSEKDDTYQAVYPHGDMLDLQGKL